jgi:hypothetical protein
MTPDRSSLHLAAVTLCMAGALLVWVELSLTEVAPHSDRHTATMVAPGLAIAVQDDASAEGRIALRQTAGLAKSANFTR